VNVGTVWDKFLELLKSKVSPISYNLWFKDIKLVSLSNNKAKLLVSTDEDNIDQFINTLIKNYYDLIKELIDTITDDSYDLEFLRKIEEEQQQDTVIKNNELISYNEEYDTDITKYKYYSNFDPKYTFETFVVGDSNRLAYGTALAVAKKPGSLYNPFFIHGKSGLGKTHLMHAIGNYIHKNSSKTVLYVTSEKFVSDFIGINKRNKDGNNFDNVEIFKNKYRNVDVLIIDDIQYLGNANQTQQEFFNTFNDLYGNNKQIIISSDRSPDDLKLLEDRLRTRFNWGLTINILQPDFKLRMNIIDKKIEGQMLIKSFPIDVKEYIASNCTTDIRKLEGAITRVVAYATMMNGSDITLDLAIEALKDYFVKSIISKNKIDQVQQLVANNYNITVEELKSKRRVATIAVPRQIAMYICRVHLEESLPKIGIEFGGKDHTTVMHSVDKIKKQLKTDNSLEVEINKIISQIK